MKNKQRQCQGYVMREIHHREHHRTAGVSHCKNATGIDIPVGQQRD